MLQPPSDEVGEQVTRRTVLHLDFIGCSKTLFWRSVGISTIFYLHESSYLHLEYTKLKISINKSKKSMRMEGIDAALEYSIYIICKCQYSKWGLGLF